MSKHMSHHNRGNTLTKTSKAAALKNTDISYKNYKALSNATSSHGRILPKRLSGLTAKSQRKFDKAVKIARFLGLMPYCGIA